MKPSPVMRIIDENMNRLAEGLRVLEDMARMVLNDGELTQQLKTLRHNLIRADLPFNLELLRSRDSTTDIGANSEVDGEKREKNLPLLAVANSRRAQESLRVLEEVAKLPEVSSSLDSNQFKNARFELYTIEQKLVSRLIQYNDSKSKQ
jgi:thiamine-phosphate pyrophosphorylase